ncbi:MAG TPA: N-6 DNA methylase [Verrucomicrobiae bacterium]
MAVESKPLFHPEVIRQHLRSFILPEHLHAHQAKLNHWADLITSGRADNFKETDLLPDFLTDFFCNLLGYTRPAGPTESFTLSRETHVEVDGQFADAALGRFSNDAKKFIVALEGKGPRDPLDRPFAGRRMSAVDQGYRYAINLPCDWIIVTSMRETRLYHKGSNQHSFERFETVRLAKEPSLLKRFIFLLGAERVVPATGDSHLYQLLKASESVGRELTDKFYSLYADIREKALVRLCQENSAIPPQEILRCTQKLLDRVLFCAFSEDRGLLPPDTLRNAFSHRDPYNPKPIWHNFRGLFRSIDQGNAGLNIPAYNGGLFAADPVLDSLNVPDEVCTHFKDLSDYDYRPSQDLETEDEHAEVRSLIDVDILGHIFEQSITDLERLRHSLASGAPIAEQEAKARRKKEGAFYTPAFITRYIVEQALGGVLQVRFETLRQKHEAAATGTSRKPLADPNAYDLSALNAPQRKTLTRFWEAWQEELMKLRILDPACGSGAFLIEAFDQLYAVYETSNQRLEELRGQRTLFDLDRQILQHNLYGVDLNPEAIQICQLSLWIKTAARGKILTSLDHSIREGNSVINDPAVHPKAFHWQSAFPEVFAQGGFDVVIGNPPYVRQEFLTPYKPWLEQHYETFHGKADLYVYFYELGTRLLKPGGLLSFIVTNKWMKASYGEPLRRFFGEKAWIKSVVDFGHAKQIFEEADVFPSIIVVEKPTTAPKPTTARLCTIPREQLRIDDLSVQIEKQGVELKLAQLSGSAWQLEASSVTGLFEQLRDRGVPLRNFLRAEPIYGLKTGCNAAFFVSSSERQRLIAADPKCESLFVRYFRGQDIERWNARWDEEWLIALRSSNEKEWPWSKLKDGENVFATAYPSVYRHMEGHKEALLGRKNNVRFWWELSAFASWPLFEKPKLVYQEIQFHPAYALEDEGIISNNKTFILPTGDKYLLAVLNSPLMWWFNWRHLPHMKDEALTPAAFLIEEIPIAEPAPTIREATEKTVSRLIEITASQQQAHRTLLDWLRVEYAIEKPSNKLQDVTALDSDAFVAEVKRIRGKKLPLTAAGLHALREEYQRTIEPARALAAETLNLETTLSDLVNKAYGLSPDEIDLMWKTAPPRMPIPPPPHL